MSDPTDEWEQYAARLDEEQEESLLAEASDDACEAISRIRDYLEQRLTYRDVQPAMELIYAVGRTAKRHDQALRGGPPLKLSDEAIEAGFHAMNRAMKLRPVPRGRDLLRIIGEAMYGVDGLRPPIEPSEEVREEFCAAVDVLSEMRGHGRPLTGEELAAMKRVHAAADGLRAVPSQESGPTPVPDVHIAVSPEAIAEVLEHDFPSGRGDPQRRAE